MENRETEKTPKAPKLFLAVGPTLHYSHRNVQRCWLLAVIAFAISCLMWSRIVTGTFWAFDLESQTTPNFWRLDQAAVTGASIFEYPWQIVVLGLLMGVLAVVPLLISQLMSFGHSIIFLLAVAFLANLPGFAVSLFVSCFAVACRPLRFRSRIIAIALCMAPQLLYWGFLGGAQDVEPLEWGFSFAPWIWAWIVGLTIAGLVLGIGHYTRYRPGLNWIFTTTTLLLALGVFEWQIGFDELDYQFHIAGNNPEQVAEFHDHNIRELLDKTITDPGMRKTLAGFFFPTDPIPLREELKSEIQIQLSLDRWPKWFDVPEELKYQQRREELNEQYDRFIHPPKAWWMPDALHKEIVSRRSKSLRMPIALYYRALLSEYSPDLRRLRHDEVLHFYSDYPHERAGEIWFELYRDFGAAPESAEARWRIARHLGGRGRFTQAASFLDQADMLVQEQLTRRETAPPGSDSLFSAFRPPAETVMTVVKLRELQRRIRELQTLIGEENLQGSDGAAVRLARFVAMNPHSVDYGSQLANLLGQTAEQDGLRDNLLLAQAKLIPDDQGRAERLSELNRQFQNTDGGIQALYELTRLKIRLFQEQGDRDRQRRLLTEARDMLNSFLNLYPDSFYVEQVERNLEDLPRLQ